MLKPTAAACRNAMNRLTAIASALVTAATVAGCSASPDNDSTRSPSQPVPITSARSVPTANVSPSPLKVCELISTADLTRITGLADWSGGPASPDGSLSGGRTGSSDVQCTWTGPKLRTNATPGSDTPTIEILYCADPKTQSLKADQENGAVNRVGDYKNVVALVPNIADAAWQPIEDQLAQQGTYIGNHGRSTLDFRLGKNYFSVLVEGVSGDERQDMISGRDRNALARLLVSRLNGTSASTPGIDATRTNAQSLVPGPLVTGQLARIFSKAKLISPTPYLGAHDNLGFSTPSGNISCLIISEISPTSLVCQIHKYDFNQPGPNCTDGAEVSIAHTGVPSYKGCAANAYDYTVLPYGQSVSYAGFGCVSSEQGVACVRTSSSTGFFLSRERLQLVR